MPKKKGGKKQMTEEERAQAAETLKRMKEETLILCLKYKLQKEAKNTATNLLKLNEAWRTVLRQTLHGDLQNEIILFSQTFERKLESLNNLIKCLVHDLGEAELWEGQARRSHLQHVECLQALQKKRLKILLEQWERGLRELDFTLTREREQISAVSEQQCIRLEDVTFELQHQHHELEAELQSLHDDIRAAYQCAHQERITEIQEQHEHKTSSLAVEIQNCEWISYAPPEEPDEFLIQNENVCQVTEADLKKLQDTISKLKKTLISSKRESEMAGTDLRAAREEVTRKIRELQADMSQSHDTARKQLTELAIHSTEAIKKLQRDIAEGERILNLAKMCRKLESEQEKVLPSFISPINAEHQSREGQTEELAMEVPIYPEMEQVWRSYNASMLQQEALKKEKEHLNQENQQLQALLRQHLDALIVSDHQTLNERDAPILTVHQAPQNSVTVQADPNRQHIYHTIIEAAHVIKYT